MTDFQEISKDDKTPTPISLGLGVYLCNFFSGELVTTLKAWHLSVRFYVKHRLKF